MIRHCFWLTLVFSAASISAEKSCVISGDIVHWQMAYCMAEYETDDPANPAVDACFNDLVTVFELGDASECDFKQYIATSLCLGMLVNVPEVGSVKQCLADPKYYPSIVNDGGI